MFEALKKRKSPDARLALLEATLAPQIADAERAALAQKSAVRAATIAERADELAAMDAERAKLEDALAKAATKLDAAIRAQRAADAAHTEAYDALRTANYRRDVTAGRYERTLGALGNDIIATTVYRLRWLLDVAESKLNIAEPPKVLKVYQKAADFRRLDWSPEELAEIVGRALPAVQALEFAAVSLDEIETACTDSLTRSYAAAGETLLKSAPWATVATLALH